MITILCAALSLLCGVAIGWYAGTQGSMRLIQRLKPELQRQVFAAIVAGDFRDKK